MLRINKGERALSLQWNPVAKIEEALNVAFDMSFGNIESTGSRVNIGLDVSGSMFMSTIAGTHITAGLAAAAMAKITASSEDYVDVVAFSERLIPFPLRKTDSLKSITDRMGKINFGRTDCALPISRDEYPQSLQTMGRELDSITYKWS